MLRLWLTLIEDDKDRMTIALPPGASWMLGRDESMNELVLHDGTVSRLHARLIFQQDRYMLHDVHSKSGVFCNDKKIDGFYQLQSGDVMRVGKSDFRVKLAEWSMADEDEHTETLMG